MNDIIIKEYSEKDKQGSISLLKDTFPGSSNEETFTWRYEAYNKLKPIIVVAVENDKVISFVSWIPWIFTFGDKELIGYQACEGATNPEYRNKGLFTKMFLFSENIAKEIDVDFYFGFPSKMSYGPVYRAGYFPIIKFDFVKKNLLPLSFNKFNQNTNHKLSNDDLFVKEIDKISPIFDYVYYDWRFQKNPLNYETLFYEENNNRAVFILRSNRYTKKKFGIIPRKVMIVDFQTTSYYDKFIENALRFLFNEFRNRASYITTFFNPFTMRGILLSKYFKSRTTLESRILCVRPINNDIRHILFNSKLWDLMPHTVDYY